MLPIADVGSVIAVADSLKRDDCAVFTVRMHDHFVRTIFFERQVIKTRAGRDVAFLRPY